MVLLSSSMLVCLTIRKCATLLIVKAFSSCKNYVHIVGTNPHQFCDWQVFFHQMVFPLHESFSSDKFQFIYIFFMSLVPAGNSLPNLRTYKNHLCAFIEFHCFRFHI